MEIRRIALSLIRENDYNPNEMKPAVFESLVASIRDNGFVQPILVKPDGEFYVIVDGAHRFRALKKLGRMEADCVIVPENTIAAELFTLSMNRLRGRMDKFREAGILENLKDEEIERYLAYTEKQRKEIQSLIAKMPKLDLPKIEPVRRPMFLEFVMSVEDASLVERAIAAVGAKNRLDGLLAICRFFLDCKNAEGEGDE